MAEDPPERLVITTYEAESAYWMPLLDPKNVPAHEGVLYASDIHGYIHPEKNLADGHFVLEKLNEGTVLHGTEMPVSEPTCMLHSTSLHMFTCAGDIDDLYVHWKQELGVLLALGGLEFSKVPCTIQNCSSSKFKFKLAHNCVAHAAASTATLLEGASFGTPVLVFKRLRRQSLASTRKIQRSATNTRWPRPRPWP